LQFGHPGRTPRKTKESKDRKKKDGGGEGRKQLKNDWKEHIIISGDKYF